MKKSNLKIIYLSLISILILTILILIPINQNKKFYSESYQTKNVNKQLTTYDSYNIVFFKKDCPYCKVGLNKVKALSKKNKNIPTLFIDVESETGIELTKIYNVQKAFSIVKVRDQKSEILLYAEKENNKIKPNMQNIYSSFKET